MKKSTKSTSAKREQWADDARERDAALKKSLEDATAQLLEELRQGKTERLTSYLTFASRFYRYSANNQILIQMQCPDASHVAGYRTWEVMPHQHTSADGTQCSACGYHVRKGAKGIRILAPRTYKKTVTDEKTHEEREVSLMYFKSVSVFDASQLDSEEVAEHPLPHFYTDLGGDEQTDALRAKIVAQMHARGIEVVESDALPGGQDGTQGYSAGGFVAIRKGLSSRNAIRTLTHEWAHELLHQKDGEASAEKRRGVQECHAEATSYIVLAHFGIHNEFSSDYLQHWGNTPDTLMQELTSVQRASSTIIAALEAKHEDSASAETCAASA